MSTRERSSTRSSTQNLSVARSTPFHKPTERLYLAIAPLGSPNTHSIRQSLVRHFRVNCVFSRASPRKPPSSENKTSTASSPPTFLDSTPRVTPQRALDALAPRVSSSGQSDPDLCARARARARRTGASPRACGEDESGISRIFFPPRA